MAVCLATSLATAAVAANAFTLAWTHSIERVRWEEAWRVEGEALVLERVRVRGRAWEWHPRTRHAVLRLTRSAYTADYEWCADGEPCKSLSALIASDGGVTELRACPIGDTAP